MSKCIVTGCAGFIGSHVTDLLIEQGHTVWGIDDFSTGYKKNLNPKIKRIWAEDISSKWFYQRLPKVDYVFHFAALARIQPSIEKPMPSHKVNINGTLNVLEYCRRVGAKIIFSSSSSIFDDIIPQHEGSPIRPKNPYALQKYVSEQYIKLYHELYGLDYAILRYFNVYGERQILEGAYAAVVGIFLKQRSEGKPLTIFGTGQKRRDFTYVKDVAQANIKAMDHQGTFNIGTGKNYSINEIADFVGGDREYYPDKPGEALETKCENAITRQVLDWQPTKDIKDWIDEQN